jgi:hypothetical protein
VKKLVTFRLDPDLLGRLKRAAKDENRTLTNFVETTLLRALEQDDRARPQAPHSARDLPH